MNSVPRRVSHMAQQFSERADQEAEAFVASLTTGAQPAHVTRIASPVSSFRFSVVPLFGSSGTYRRGVSALSATGDAARRLCFDKV